MRYILKATSPRAQGCIQERVNPMKIEKQFKSLIKDCSNQGSNCFVVAIERERSKVTGVSKNSLVPQAAIVLIQHNQQWFVKGSLDGVSYEFSSIDGLDASEPILFGIDCRIQNNNLVFYKSGKSINKISSKTEIDSTDIMYLYWEYETYTSLTFCAYDSVRDEVIREVVSGNNEPMKRFLRTITIQALRSSEVNRGNSNAEYDTDEYFTEDHNDTIWNLDEE